jgi:hypothetical protein
MKVPINKFFEYFCTCKERNPEVTGDVAYAMAEAWYSKKYGKRRYKNYDVFRVTFNRYLKVILSNQKNKS